MCFDADSDMRASSHFRTSFHGAIVTSLVFVAVTLLWSGCKRNSSSATVARVDDQALTLDEIRARLDTTRGVSEVQMRQFVRRWLNDEVLYREALRRGLDRQTGLDERVDDFRRQLVINALLQEEVYNDRTAHSTPEEIASYYEAHRSEFVLTQDVARVSYMFFSDRDVATVFRNAILNGESWNRAAVNVETDVQHAVAVLGRVDSVYATQQSLVPPELWRVAANAREREPSFPIAASGGYYVLTLWKFMRSGQRAEPGYVRAEIVGRLAVERRMRQYDSLVTALRGGHNVQVFSIERGDTAVRKNVD